MPYAPQSGRSSMVERELPKLYTRVRFPSPAPEFLDVILLCLFFNQPILFHPGIVMLLFDRFNEVITHASIFSTELSGVIRICSTMNATDNLIYAASSCLYLTIGGGVKFFERRNNQAIIKNSDMTLFVITVFLNLTQILLPIIVALFLRLFPIAPELAY